jgi:hypothetical protein
MYPAILCLSTLVSGGPVPDPPKEAMAPPQVEAVCLDGSVLKVALLDESVVLVTKHGELNIPVKDIRGIEVANRTPPGQKAEIDDAIAKLGHPDFAKREEATARLKRIGPRAYPACVTAAKGSDPEVSRRAEGAASYIQAKHENLTLRPNDVVYTDDSKLVGTLKCDALKVVTGQFGEQSLRLSDIDKVRAGVSADENAKPAPINLNSGEYQNQFGKEFVFKVTGKSPDNPANACVWGKGPYSLDSKLEVAAVHAGVVKAGETKVVRVRIVPSPPVLEPSTANGITTAGYGAFPTGAYEFVQ